MKIRHILVNILPLPLWIAYYYFTMSKNTLFLMPFDELILLLIILAFSIYNLLSDKIVQFLVRNLIMIVSLTAGCYVSGPMYLKLCYHMSDEHYAVKSIPFENAKEAIIITVIFCVIWFIIDKRKAKRSEHENEL